MNKLEINRTEQEREELVKSWIRHNWHYALAILLISIGIIYGINHYNKQKEDTKLNLADQLATFNKTLENNELDQAFNQAEKLQNQAPNSSFASISALSMGKALFDAQDYEKAVITYDWIIKNSKDISIKEIAYIRKAKALASNNQVDLAIQSIDFLTSPILEKNLNQLKGDFYLKNNEFSKAEAAYLAAKGDENNLILENKLILINSLKNNQNKE